MLYGKRASARLVLLCGVSLLATGQAFAFDTATQEDPVTIEEVVVTAQKRTQRISEVPMSISAYDGAALERLGATELERVAQVTPGVTIQLQDRLLPGISMRGITSDDTSPAAEPRVALFQDGVPITQIASAYGEMFDVDRVEVEKGPQSTLHGRSALNGGISTYQKMPGTEREVEARIGFGDYGHKLAHVIANVPVNDQFAFRIGALKRERDGYLENTDGGTYNSVDSQAYRLTAIYNPTEDLGFRFAATYDLDDTDSGAAFKSNIFTPRDRATGTVIGDTNYWSPTNTRAFGELPEGYSKRDILGLSLTTDYAINDVFDITAITGYRKYSACQAGDIDGSTMDIIGYEICNDGKQFSQEARLNIRRTGNFEGFVGTSYFHADNTGVTDLGIDERAAALLLSGALHRNAPMGLTLDQMIGALGANAGNYKPFHMDRRMTGAKMETIDLFADGTYHFSDRLQGFAGMRVTWDDKDVVMQANTPRGVSRLTGSGLLIASTPGGQVVSGSHGSTLTTGRIGARYEVTPDVNVYAVYGVGKRPEVIDLSNTGAATILPAEELASTEVGVKYRLFDGRLSGDASIYQFDYSNFLTYQRISDRLVPINAGEAKATGFEAQGTWWLTDGLSLFGSYAYNKARFEGGAYDGNRFRSSPDNKFALGVNAVVPTRLGELSISPLYTWQSKIFFSDDNDRSDLQIRSRAAFNDTAVDEYQDAYGLLHLRVNFQPTNANWSLAVYGENLLDEKFIVDAGNTGDAFGMPTFIVGTRKNMRVELTARF